MSDFQTTRPPAVSEQARVETAPLDTAPAPVVRLRDPDAAAEGPPPDLLALLDGLSERYQLLGQVGRGGMGMVLRGRDPALGRELAIKLLLDKYADRPDVVRRFREEAQVGGQLQHPGVVPVHELGVAGGQSYFTMKLVRGTTLDALLRQRRDPAQERPRFLKIFEAVCQTVAYAHSRGVIHRDLKPGNVMVGAFGEVQVMDWGLAKVLTRDSQADSIAAAAVEAAAVVEVSRAGASDFGTQAGEVLGTPPYMPPERARGELDRLDERCDVFSLGAILCEVLTGRPPYAGSDVPSVLRRARCGDLADAFARLDGCGADAELTALARCCLTAEPAERPANGGEVARAVEAYLAGIEERARQAELERAAAMARAEEARATARAERRARRLTGGLAAAALLLVVAGGAGAWLLQRQHADAHARTHRADEQTRLVLRSARELLAQGWRDNDLDKLTRASAEADKALEIARGGASPAVLQEADTLREEIEQQHDQANRNETLLAALLNAHLPFPVALAAGDEVRRPAGLVERSQDQNLGQAFRDWGLDVDRVSVEAAVRRLQAQPARVVREVVAALDTWISIRLGQRRHDEVERLLRLVERLDRYEPQQHLRRLLASGRLRRDRFVEELSRVLLPWSALVGPQLEEGRLQELRRLAAAVQPARAPVLYVILLAQALKDAGALRETEGFLRAAVAARPTEVLLLTRLAQLLERQGGAHSQEALGYYTAARALRPRLGILLAVALSWAGRFAEGEIVLRELLPLQPDSVEVNVMLGTLSARQHKLADAETCFRRVLARRPRFAEIHANLGTVLRQQKKPAAAEAALRRALALAPDLVIAHNELGLALYDQGKDAEAEAAFRAALVLKPADSRTYNYLGNALRRQKKYAAADAACRRAIALDPGNAPALCNLGSSLAARNKLDEAVAAFRQASAARPPFPKAYHLLGRAPLEQKKPEEAARAFRRAIALQPDNPRAYADLGVALRSSKKLKESVAALRTAVRGLPNHARLRQLLRDTERMLALDEKLADVLAGKGAALRPKEQLELGLFCTNYKRRHHAAVRLLVAAFAARPALATDLSAQNRYGAACAAALAAAGKGEDAGKLDGAQRARLRQQALAWLRADLKVYKALVGEAANRAMVKQRLRSWVADAGLAGVREPAILAALPEKERDGWLWLWAEVSALLRKVQAP